MKQTKSLIILLLAVALVVALTLTACTPTQPTEPSDPEHTCRHLCSTCDKCTDKSCADPVCEDKCQGHGSTGGGDEHKCSKSCPKDGCGKCLDKTCQEEACKQKCPGHTQGGGETPEIPSGSVTVTLLGLGNTVTTNLETAFEWEHDGDYTRTMSPAEASVFYLPYARYTQMGKVMYVYKDGFKLTGWECSAHPGVTHNPGENHPLTQDTTFTAVFVLDLGSTDFDGDFTATQPIDISYWADAIIVRAVIDYRTLTLYDEKGDSVYVITLDIDGNTAFGENGASFTVTLTLDGDTLTISIKRLNSTTVGTFVRQ